ncbi:hypothetical protein [Coprobacter fastidiosus]|jgi:hypothetical protein|uniref:hypothetical protein n=1 Tax=Coprobacter fastidiosus TaxID=1099853 RepID=UPI000240F25E|nr:hypothetical protein [Coprobacter fastidiosus]EHL84982.1 hypothetical protein HMPREF1033_01743 [Tannerella sp. 6_1_58FAA_CT1]
MKELTLLEKKLIVLLKYKIKSAFFLESKIELEAIIEKIRTRNLTNRQIEMAWHDFLDGYELADTKIEDSEDLREIDRLLIENFGEGEGLAPEKWKMNRKIRTILKRGIRDAEEARMVDDYICQTTDEDEIKRAETVLQEFEEKIKALLQKDHISSKSEYSFLSKYRIELNDDTPAAQKIDSMIEDFRTKKNC